MTDASNIQSDFIQLLKNKINPKVSFSETVADLLGISSDSAYRRIRGETALTLIEAKILADYFHISIENLITSSNNDLGFTYKVLDDKEITFENYLSSIQIDVQKFANCEKSEMIYAAKDLPVFHHFNFPELAAFKIFYWMKSIMNVAEYESKKFDRELINQKFIEMGRRIIRGYEKVPTTEIWTEETVNSTVKQIEYFWESGFFQSTEDALLVCNQLSQMVDHIKAQATLEKSFQLGSDVKDTASPFKLYYSEVMIGNNNVLANFDGKEVK